MQNSELASNGISIAANRVVSMKTVVEMTSASRATIYNWVNDGVFPAPVQLGRRRIGWREADVASWLESRQGVAWASLREAA
jgi:prophage regulatory protein